MLCKVYYRPGPRKAVIADNLTGFVGKVDTFSDLKLKLEQNQCISFMRVI